MDEPSTFEPRAVLTPRGAGRSRLAVTVPAFALAITVWVGTSGPRSGDEQSALRSQPTTAPSSGRPAEVAPRPTRTAYPAKVLGLEVLTLDDLGGRSRRHGPAIAVVGWYVPRTAAACPPPATGEGQTLAEELGVVADTRTFCERSGLLLAAAPRPGSPHLATDGPALTVVLTPGVAVPAGLDEAGRTASQVILVGRMIDGDPACSGRVPCRRDLLVDRVVWAAGRDRAETTSVLPTLLDSRPRLPWHPRDRLAEAAVGPTGALLLETLVDPATLAAVDPVAAALIARTAPAAQRIWYRRALPPDPAREAPRWVAIDDATGKVIGTGSVDR
jgi:hypothetical protein